jgi:hypothetical protein
MRKKRRPAVSLSLDQTRGIEDEGEGEPRGVEEHRRWVKIRSAFLDVPHRIRTTRHECSSHLLYIHLRNYIQTSSAVISLLMENDELITADMRRHASRSPNITQE